MKLPFIISFFGSFLLALSGFIYLYLLEPDNTAIFSFLILAMAGIFIYRSTFGKLLFLSSFFINCTAAIFFYFYFKSINSGPFIGGGDDHFFFTGLLNAVDKGFVKLNRISIWWYRYWLFLYINFNYILCLDFLGIWDRGLLHNIFLSGFIGAHITRMCSSIASKVFNTKVGHITALLSMLFPYLIYNYATFLRETYVLFFVVLTFYLLFCFRTSSKLKYLLALLASVFNTIGLRVETGLPNILMALYKTSYKQRFLKLIYIGSIIPILYFSYNSLSKRINAQELYYAMNLTKIAEVESGIGAKLAEYDGTPIGIAAYSFLAVFNPIPPVGHIERLDDLFNGVGWILWYSVVIFAFFGIIKYDGSKDFRVASLIIILGFIIISFKLNGSIRHRTPLLPFAFMYCSYALTILKRRLIFDILKVSSIMIFLFCLIYISLKFIL